MKHLHDVFFENLNKIHIKSGLKKSHVATLLGVSKVSVGKWFAGEHTPSFKMVEKLAKVYSVDWSSFFSQK